MVNIEVDIEASDMIDALDDSGYKVFTDDEEIIGYINESFDLGQISELIETLSSDRDLLDIIKDTIESNTMYNLINPTDLIQMKDFITDNLITVSKIMDDINPPLPAPILTPDEMINKMLVNHNTPLEYIIRKYVDHNRRVYSDSDNLSDEQLEDIVNNSDEVNNNNTNTSVWNSE